ncbi:MAG TPA: hypothetical protein VFA90_03555 [Terriglobales bacterium]|nr:hypothetical protein [Terriglobales bacterium]
MKKLFGSLIVLAVMAAMALPALAQVQQMTSDDNQAFNGYYSRWLQDKQTGNRDDMMSMEHHMQDIMSKYAIPPSTPYDQVAAQNNGAVPPAYSSRPASQWQGVLSSGDQDKFNKEYTKWQESNAKNDRDDIDKHARNMEEIMNKYNIPPNTPFAQIASVSSMPHTDVTQYQGRFSPDDQKKYDKAYEHWQEDRAKNDRNKMYKDEGQMQEVMARYNIPRDVPFAALASGNRGY